MKHIDLDPIINQYFISPIHVLCPRCQSKALISGVLPAKALDFNEKDIQFSCIYCSYSVKYINIPKFSFYTDNSRISKERGRLLLNIGCDPFFGFSLWYRIDTNYGVLWAYNLEHLMAIGSHIANLPNDDYLLSDNDSFDYLPDWATQRKNREYLLRLINHLKNVD